MGTAAVAITVVSAVIGAGAAIQSGRAQAAAAEFQADEAERQGEQQKLQALDDELQRRRDLSKNLAASGAQGAQSGFDPFSAGSSFLALREEVKTEAARDVSAIRLLGANQQRTSKLNVQQSKVAGSAARTQGFLRAAGTVSDAGKQLAATRKT